MHIHLIAVGRKMPDWVQQGYDEYSKRLPAELKPKLHEIAPVVRNKSTDTGKAKLEEAARIQRVIPEQAHVICLDEHGASWNTVKLSKQLETWTHTMRHVALVIGGADGFDKDFLKQANQTWSLSPLTLPHGMVRVVLIEQLYRAWSLLKGHPYHRA
jgi:23S rRNA (pseudouridine1915-N3)-methyltransferase